MGPVPGVWAGTRMVGVESMGVRGRSQAVLNAGESAARRVRAPYWGVEGFPGRQWCVRGRRD